MMFMRCWIGVLMVVAWLDLAQTVYRVGVVSKFGLRQIDAVVGSFVSADVTKRVLGRFFIKLTQCVEGKASLVGMLMVRSGSVRPGQNFSHPARRI